MKVLITGGCGFIGHHMVDHVLANTDWDVDIVDKLTYASFGFERLKATRARDNPKVRVFTWDISQPITGYLLKELNDCDYIIHMAAESHVDNSISDPTPFIMSNVVGTMNILEFARNCKQLKRMIYFSTDEVFGPADNAFLNGYKEWDRHNPGNPYSATKAAGEELSLAWHNTYKVPVVVTHCVNVFGERQHPEKFIPKVAKSILEGRKIYIHADPTKTIPGSRYWIHARNVAAATLFVLNNGIIGDKYNIVGENEVDNLEVAQLIAGIIGKSLDYELVDFHSSRPGHDLSYCLNGSKLKSMGFAYPKSFEDTMHKTVTWTVSNPKWLEE